MQREETKIVNPDIINVFRAVGWAGGSETSYLMQVNWTIGASGHAKRKEKIFRSKWKWVSRDAAPPPLLLNGLRAGYPTVAPSSEIYAESWVNRPGQSAL